MKILAFSITRTCMPGPAEPGGLGGALAPPPPPHIFCQAIVIFSSFFFSFLNYAIIDLKTTLYPQCARLWVYRESSLYYILHGHMAVFYWYLLKNLELFGDWKKVYNSSREEITERRTSRVELFHWQGELIKTWMRSTCYHQDLIQSRSCISIRIVQTSWT